MERLSDEELKTAIEKGLINAGYRIFERTTKDIFNAIREAERGKGDAIKSLAHGGITWDCEPPTPYADKVLEVATRLAVSWASSFNAPASGLESRVQYFTDAAVKLIQAANNAAIQNAMKREG